MRRRLFVVFAALATAFTMLPAGAQVPDEEIVIDRAAPQILERIGLDVANKPAPGLEDVVTVFVYLEGQSVAELMASAKAQGQGLSQAAKTSQAKAIERQQANFMRQLERLGAKYEWSLQWAANGIAISAKVQDLMEIQSLAGVVSISGIAEHYPINDGSVPWIVSPEVQAAAAGGEGISIGIIDTGIDYTHANFGGPGTIEAYQGNDPTVIETNSFPLLGGNVVGGYDFVGDAYDASSRDASINTPDPDDDPLDCNGHGTHVAGTAAGLGVADLIGPGVAPAADLYALKVFGCDGSTAVTAQAIDWAVANDLDVINMSLGSDFGGLNDPSVVASENAAAAGVIVVAAAGNDGNIPYVTGSPAVAPSAISVAASYDGNFGDGAIRVNSSPDGTLDGLHPAQEGAIGPPLSVVGAVTGDIAVALDGGSATDPTFACGPIVTDVDGKIALIQRGECSFGIKIANAEAAGAIATIVYNDAARGDALLTMGFASSDHPSVFIGHTAGSAIAANAGDGVNVTLDADLEILDPTLADHIAGFSSSGPGSNLFKPEVAAPGVRIRSAAVGTGDKYANFQGTSMASPHIAGVAALLRYQYPDVEVDVIKSLIMNSATPAADGSPIVRQGTGVVRADAAAALDAYTSPAGLSFGRLNPVGSGSWDREITVHDMSGAAREFAVSAALLDAPTGVEVTVSTSSLSVPADGSASFVVTMSLDPAAMNFDDGFFSQSNASGIVTVTDTTASLRVGFTAAVDPASAVEVLTKQKKGQEDLLLIANPSQTVGWVDSYTYSGPGVGSVAAVGFRADVAVQGYPDGVVEFGIAQSAPWENLSIRETDIYLDTDEDGVWDYVLVAADLGYLTTGFADGTVVTALLNLSTGSFVLQWLAISDHNDHVQTLLVDRHGPFGFLEPGNKDFDYLVLAFDLRFGPPDGLATGSVDLTKADTNYTFGIGPTQAGILRPTPQNRDAMLWTFQNNAVPDQFQVVKLAPNNKGGNSANAPGKGDNDPPGQGGTPPGKGPSAGAAVGQADLVGHARAALRGPIRI